MKRLLTYLLLLFFGSCLYAETLFYKKDGTELTPAEHEKVYNIMIKYQFPISAFFGTYVDNELVAMRKEIKEVLPNASIEPAFISTTLYQLWILYFINKNWNSLEKASEGTLERGYNGQISSHIYATSIPENFEIDLKEKNNITLHRIVNNFIIKTLQENKLEIPRNSIDAIKLFKTLYLWDSNLQGSEFTFQELFGPSDSLSKVIERAIEVDYKAYNYNWFPLHRSSGKVDSDEEEAYGVWRSISFGTSIFGGRIHDPGACVHNFFRRINLMIYTTLIDKKSYAKGSLKNLFFIPPLTAIQDIFGYGEFFHSRSKVPSLKKINRLSFQKGLKPNDPLQQKYYEIDTSFPGGAHEGYRKIREYIQKNHIILTDDTPIRITSRKSLPPSRPLPEFIPPKKAAKGTKKSKAPTIPLPEFHKKTSQPTAAAPAVIKAKTVQEKKASAPAQLKKVPPSEVPATFDPKEMLKKLREGKAQK